jgi:hypothetical protein
MRCAIRFGAVQRVYAYIDIARQLETCVRFHPFRFGGSVECRAPLRIEFIFVEP